MGEAKWRQANDPNFGQPKPDDKHRGIVVSIPMTIEGTRISARHGRLDPSELRFALMYWDELVWPDTRFIRATDPDTDYLQAEGIIIRPQYPLYGDMATAVASAQVSAFLEREAQAPGRWALAQGENSLILRSHAAVFGNDGCSLELLRAIPIPKHDVPIAEILEFKSIRRTELLRLREEIDSLGTSIAEAANKAEALDAGLRAVDEACGDLVRVGREWRTPFALSDVKIGLSVSMSSVVNAAAAFSTAHANGLPLTTSALTGAATMAASSISLKRDLSLRNPRLPAHPFRYAYLMHEDLR